MNDTGTGRCLCGVTTYEYKGPVRFQGHCHCESCRRNCSAPFTSYFGVPSETMHWTGAVPGVFNSSVAVRRSFCTTCGAPMAFESDAYPSEVHLYAASLDDPTTFQPTFHLFYNQRLPWVDCATDGLKKFPGNGNSGLLRDTPLTKTIC